MNKIKKGGKHSLASFLFLSLMVFGIGSISYAVFNIWSQSGYYVDTNSGDSSSIASAAELNKLKMNIAGPVKADYSNVSTLEKAIYTVYPLEGDDIGSLTIPILNRKLPIIQGTGAAELKKGVGHFTQSVLPGEKDNCVISGHRDTAFRQLDKLKLGDEIIVQTSTGTFTYKVTGTRIVHENDKTVIVPMNHAVLTLTTCYPFDFIGAAPDRYIVSANLVKSK